MSALLDYVYDDGGRAAAGFQGSTGDCVTRAVAIACALPYREVYDEVLARKRVLRDYEVARGKGARDVSPRAGVPRKIYQVLLEECGFAWHGLVRVGSRERTHLLADELPAGRLVCRLSGHLTTVLDHTIHDTFDPRRPADGRETRMVYGYFAPAS